MLALVRARRISIDKISNAKSFISHHLVQDWPRDHGGCSRALSLLNFHVLNHTPLSASHNCIQVDSVISIVTRDMYPTWVARLLISTRLLRFRAQ